MQISDRRAWEALHPGQFVVFLSNAATDVLLDEDGKPADDETEVPVFESMAVAEEYAERAVARLAAACAEIYDERGRAGDPLRRVYHQSLRKRFDPERRARRYAWIGGFLLFGFAIWSVFAARGSNEHFLWFYIAGMKLLTLGSVLFIRGVGFFIGRRRD